VSPGAAEIMTSAPGFTAIVMAAGRGTVDPVAARAGQSHKCFVKVAGKPMLLRVIETLEASPRVDRIIVCIEREARLDSIRELTARIARGDCERCASAGSPARSVLRTMEALSPPPPILVVTGDHPLLTPAMIDRFCGAAADGGDVVVGLAPARLVQAAYPHSVRTVIHFRDEPVCGCNLYALNTGAARRAVEAWAEVERWRKRPWRLVRALGFASLLDFWRGRLNLDAAMERASIRLGVRVRAVSMPFAEAAIDVDKPADLELAETILHARGETLQSGSDTAEI
jgi:GTP:adenosylcobinamide-phosphate guanylyltransferase